MLAIWELVRAVVSGLHDMAGRGYVYTGRSHLWWLYVQRTHCCPNFTQFLHNWMYVCIHSFNQLIVDYIYLSYKYVYFKRLDTPRSLYLIHTLSWVLNLFGIFFILAAHEHYSIDVFIAFYISTRLFLYYHTLANNRALYQSDCKRTRIWFPLFYFFESGVHEIVPNQFDFPFHIPKWNLNISNYLFHTKEKKKTL